MSVTTSKQTLCINQIIGQKTDTAMVEEDFVVPDIKPDILNAICSDGTVCIYKKEVMDGKVRLDGFVNGYIMYVADDEGASIRSLNTTLEFSQIIDFPAVKEGMLLEDKVTLKSLECRVLNGRKVNIKAILDMELKVLSNEELEFVKEIEEIKDIQRLDTTLNLNSLLGNGMTKVYAKDTIMIDHTDNLAEMLKVDINILNQETKISYNKVLVKADACVKMVYRTEDNRICTATNLIPIMGFIDVQDVADENLCDVRYEIKNLLVKPNNVEEHSIYIEAELEISCNVYQMKQINIIEDLYSPTVNLVYKQKQIEAMAQKEIIKDTCLIREKQFISEIGNNKIYDVEVKPSIIKQTSLTDRVLYEGEVRLNILFGLDGTNRIEAKELTIPFNFNMACAGANQNSQIESNITTTLQDFTIMPDESIEIKIDLEFTVNLSNKQSINVIEEINIEEERNEERYSLIIYFVKPGDTLWKIAKRFRSTVSNIATINAIEDENKLSIGEQLFIPIVSMVGGCA